MPRPVFVSPCLLSTLVARIRLLVPGLAFLLLAGGAAAEEPRAITQDEFLAKVRATDPVRQVSLAKEEGM